MKMWKPVSFLLALFSPFIFISFSWKSFGESRSPFEFSVSEIYTRYAAKEYCSCRFVIGQSESVCRREVKILSALVRIEEDQESRSVRAQNHLSKSEAVWVNLREGCQLQDIEAETQILTEYTEVEFGEEIATCKSREEIWRQLEISAENSENSWLWPNSRSVMKGEGLFDGAQAQVTYKSFFSDFTYGYEIGDVLPLEQFAYRADKKHAFQGGALVRLFDAGEGRVTLSWRGKYLIPRSNSSGRRFFQNFSQNFFRDLRRNLQRGC